LGPRQGRKEPAGPWDLVRNSDRSFRRSNQVIQQNYSFEDEQRYQIIEVTEGLALLLVVFMDRSEPIVEVIHIITARKATKYEQDTYADQFR
jgi:uncharacterized DUF497 family protein